MYRKKIFLIYLVVLFANVALAAQTHLAVPLGHPVYHVIEQAQNRGLIRTLPSVRPFSRAQILTIITEILNSDQTHRFGALTVEERGILQHLRQELNPVVDGLDLLRGTISGENSESAVHLPWEFGFGGRASFSGAFVPVGGGYRYSPGDDYRFEGANHPGSGDVFAGTNSGIYFSWKGDLGRSVSYGLTFGGAFIRAPRYVRGRFNTFGHDWENRYGEADWARQNRVLVAYSEPLTYFPFSYTVGWDGSVWFLGSIDAGGFEGWPQIMSVSYYMIPEMAGSLLNGHVLWRIASNSREWGGMTSNSSLIINQSASPFLAAELTVMPLPWFSFSALTGMLEYGMMLDGSGRGGIQAAARTFQNGFSTNKIELNFRNFYLGAGTATIWPKRFELGQLFPLADSFLTQNNTGDFDNSALFLNVAGKHPGLGRLWFSFFADEISLGDINRNFFTMSRMMIAYQFGLSVSLPIRRLPFSSLTISYTKIEPFNYTHIREDVPWYQGLAMETNWVNRGRALGHYLPPNSDEILVRFDAMPNMSSRVSLQYQLIRHGATFGDRAVNGSSHWSELDPWGREGIRKFFLRDGAYEWMNIVRLRGEHSLTARNLPVRAFAEIGGVYSFFTDVPGETNLNSGGQSFRRVNTPQYPTSLRLIANVGVQIFPKF